MKNLTTTHRHYPKTYVDHHLQVDVNRLATAFEMVDQDINALQADQVDNRWQTLDLTQAGLEADTFYPVLLGLAPAMGSQVLELRQLQPEAAQEHPTTNWQAGLACLGDVWIGEHNLTLIRYAAAPEQDLLADYQWDQGTGCAVVWLRGQQVYQVRSSHQRLAVIEPATNQATLEALTANQVQLQPQGVVLSTTQGSHTYAPRTAIDADKVKSGQWDLLKFLDMQASLTTHASQLEQWAQAQDQLTDALNHAEAQQQKCLSQQVQQQQVLLHQQSQLLSRVQHQVQPQIGAVLEGAYSRAYLPCDGQSYPRARYPALAEHLGEARWHDDEQGVPSFRMPVLYDMDALKHLNIQHYERTSFAAVSPEWFFVAKTEQGETSIMVYDHAGHYRRTLMTIKFGQEIRGLYAAGNSLYVLIYGRSERYSRENTDHVDVVDVASGQVKHQISIASPEHICVQGDWLWVQSAYDKVIAYNLISHQTRDVVELSFIDSFAIMEDRLYVSTRRSVEDYYISFIKIYNANTGAFIEDWALKLSGAARLFIQGEVLVVVDTNRNRVYLYNRLNKAHMGSIVIPSLINPKQCYLDANRLWVLWNSHYSGCSLTSHDLSSCYASMRALSLDVA